MSPLGKLVSFFPLCTIITISSSIFYFAKQPSVASFLLILFCLYLFPVLCFRIHNLFYPLKEGKSDIQLKAYCPWWGSHQFQLIYYAVPQLEALLRIIPGAYSFWLRLWGAKIGKGVYWTPNVDIDDRPLVDIGDHTLFGHKVEMCSHVIGPKNGKMTLYLRKIKVGSEAFIGAGGRLGAGVKVDNKGFVPPLTDIYINEWVKEGQGLKYVHPRDVEHTFPHPEQ